MAQRKGRDRVHRDTARRHTRNGRSSARTTHPPDPLRRPSTHEPSQAEAITSSPLLSYKSATASPPGRAPTELSAASQSVPYRKLSHHQARHGSAEVPGKSRRPAGCLQARFKVRCNGSATPARSVGTPLTSRLMTTFGIPSATSNTILARCGIPACTVVASRAVSFGRQQGAVSAGHQPTRPILSNQNS